MRGGLRSVVSVLHGQAELFFSFHFIVPFSFGRAYSFVLILPSFSFLFSSLVL